MKLLACLLLLSAPAFCDTLYSFSGAFDYDATTGAFRGATQVSPLSWWLQGDRIVSIPGWPWYISGIEFSPTVADAQPSTDMEVYGIESEDFEGVSAEYYLIGFRPGEFGTFTAWNPQQLGNGLGYYGSPGSMTLTVTDPPSVPEPATWSLLAIALLLIWLQTFRQRSVTVTVIPEFRLRGQ